MNILFVGLDYFGYTQRIIDEIAGQGHRVQYIDIQPRGFWMNALRVALPGLYRRIVRWRRDGRLAALSPKSFDAVIFLQAHQMPVEILENLRATQPAARFILYNWDALTTHDYRAQARLFDDVYTFDRRDAEAEGYAYLPLFAIRDYQGLAPARAPARSVYTVGNIVNPARYDAVRAFAAYARAHDITFRAFLRMSPVVFLRFLRAGRWPRGVSFRSISGPALVRMVEGAAATFDFANHQAQSGHTMRVFENLCSGRKVITNNAGVLVEDFATPDRFHIYEGYDFSGVAAFLDQRLDDPGADFPQYHVQGFVRTLLGPLGGDAGGESDG